MVLQHPHQSTTANVEGTGVIPIQQQEIRNPLREGLIYNLVGMTHSDRSAWRNAPLAEAWQATGTVGKGRHGVKGSVSDSHDSLPCLHHGRGGAMLRFKDLTGMEVTEIEPKSVSDLIKFLWCCTVSACDREKKKFPLSLMDFADHIDHRHLLEWQSALSEAQEEEKWLEEGQKKVCRSDRALGSLYRDRRDIA